MHTHTHTKLMKTLGCAPPCRLPTYKISVEATLENTKGVEDGDEVQEEELYLAFSAAKASK